MSAAWITVAGLAVATVAIKAFGPLLLGGRSLPATASRLIVLLAPALLAALVITETFSTEDSELVLDARAAGLAAAGAALALRRSMLVALALAAVVAALVRALA